MQAARRYQHSNPARPTSSALKLCGDRSMRPQAVVVKLLITAALLPFCIRPLEVQHRQLNGKFSMRSIGCPPEHVKQMRQPRGDLLVWMVISFEGDTR